jgi:hypothetical protein
MYIFCAETFIGVVVVVVVVVVDFVIFIPSFTD